MFRIKQKVVCVDANGQNGRLPHAVLGKVYTVWDIDSNYQGQLGLKLEELLSGQSYADEYLYARRFRPIVSRKTDISTFTKMLTPEKVDA